MKLNIINLVMISIGAILLGAYAATLPWTLQRIVGLAIAAPAFALLIIARLQLGGAFSVRPKATVLVTSGIYSRIRNPIYIFSFALLVGLIIWYGNLWLLLLLVILGPMQMLRARKEQALLGEKFGEEYQRYKRQTWF